MNSLWQAHNTQQTTINRISGFNVKNITGSINVNDPQLMITDTTGISHAGIALYFERDNPFQQNFLIGTDGNNRAIFELQNPTANTYEFMNGDIISDTVNGSQTITHKTEYIGEIEPGKFCESIGEIFYMTPRQNKDGEIIEWNPYEDCITKIKQSEILNNKILGVITYNGGETCRFATHGDVLVKVISGSYSVGDVLIPTAGGYAKKGTSEEILNCITAGIPRIKITATQTKEENTVAGMIL